MKRLIALSIMVANVVFVFATTAGAQELCLTWPHC